ncbi:hypothetical protein [Fretibacter rubidus]|uniref:hypothetical protein n=1 Tax=Fretibacter rubidus TaxID=570162 RepID=UPI003529F5D7
MFADQHFTNTLIALVLVAGLGIVAFQRNFAKHDKLKPRMVPWMIIALGCIATGFMLLVHLMNLLGFETGGR